MAAWEPEAFYLPGVNTQPLDDSAPDIADPRLERARRRRPGGRRPAGRAPGDGALVPRPAVGAAGDAVRGPRRLSADAPTLAWCASSRTTSGSAAAVASRSSARVLAALRARRRAAPGGDRPDRGRPDRPRGRARARLPAARLERGGADARGAGRAASGTARAASRGFLEVDPAGADGLRLLGHAPAGRAVVAGRARPAAERGDAAGLGGRRGRRPDADRGRPQLGRPRRRAASSPRCRSGSGSCSGSTAGSGPTSRTGSRRRAGSTRSATSTRTSPGFTLPGGRAAGPPRLPPRAPARCCRNGHGLCARRSTCRSPPARRTTCRSSRRSTTGRHRYTRRRG